MALSSGIQLQNLMTDSVFCCRSTTYSQVRNLGPARNGRELLMEPRAQARLGASREQVDHIFSQRQSENGHGSHRSPHSLP